MFLKLIPIKIIFVGIQHYSALKSGLATRNFSESRTFSLQSILFYGFKSDLNWSGLVLNNIQKCVEWESILLGILDPLLQ